MVVGKNENRGPAYRGLLAVVIILGVLIVLGLGALIVGFVTRFGGHSSAPGPASVFVPPRNASVLGMQANGDRLILHLRMRSGEEVDVVDTENGRLVAHFAFAPARP